MKKKNNSKEINSGMLLLFLVGCLLVVLIGGYSLVLIYSNNKEDKTPTSEQMQINSGQNNVSTTEDGATATIVK